MRITNQIQDYNIHKIHYNPNFCANRIAVAEPVIDGVARKIEIFSIGKKDYPFLKKTLARIDLKKMLPSFANKPNFDVWNELIAVAGDVLGHTKKQRAYLAVCDKKTCGIIITNNNRKKGNLGILASIPVDVEKQIKGAGSSLMTAYLELAANRKLKFITLEPIINGPTNAVGFYERHNFSFPDTRASLMKIVYRDILKTLNRNKEELNYQSLKNNKIDTNLEHYLDT